MKPRRSKISNKTLSNPQRYQKSSTYSKTRIPTPQQISESEKEHGACLRNPDRQTASDPSFTIVKRPWPVVIVGTFHQANRYASVSLKKEEQRTWRVFQRTPARVQGATDPSFVITS